MITRQYILMDWERTSCCKCLLLAAKGDGGFWNCIMKTLTWPHTFVLFRIMTSIISCLIEYKCKQGRRRYNIKATWPDISHDFLHKSSEELQLCPSCIGHKLFQTLNRLGVTQCLQTARNHVDRIANDHDGCLLQWKTSVEVYMYTKSLIFPYLMKGNCHMLSI